MNTKVEELLRRAGEFQLEHFRNMDAGAVDMKAVKETVSFVDVETERILYEGLKEIVPNAGFFGEETGKSGNQDLVWIVDPLDGTTNYLSGNAHFSISVALVNGGEVDYGIVYAPYTGEVISATKGGGVWLNGKKIAPKFIDMEAKDALFVTGFPYRSKDLSEPFFKAAPEVLGLGRGIRRTGSAALDLAHLACGFFQGFWESDLQPYDVAAALLMMKENNILATNCKGQDYDMHHDRILVAGLPRVHGSLLEVIKAYYQQ